MPISDPTPKRKDVVIIQRSDDGSYYGEVHISGSKKIIYIDNNGNIDADNSASFYTTFPPPETGGLTPGNTYAITSSWASQSLSASWAPPMASDYAISASWASQSLSASWAPDITSYTSSLFGTASWANSASWAPDITSYTSSLFGTASWAVSASYAPDITSYTSSLFGTASWATNATTAEALNTTLNYSVTNLTASNALVAQSYQLTNSFFKTITGDGPYTVLAGDNGLLLGMTSSADINFNVSSSLPANFNVSLYQSGSGKVVIIGQTGVNIRNRSSKSGSAGQYALMGLTRIGTGDFILNGDTV